MAHLVPSVDPTAVHSYLSVTGWRESERSDRRRSIWEHPSGAHVYVPGVVGPDYPELISLMVEAIARTQARDADDIVIDLTWSRYDKLHVRREVPALALGFVDGLDLHSAVHDMIVASALASSEPRKSYGGRRPVFVDRFIDQARLIPSTPGSFVVRALLPLNLPSDQDELPLVGPAATQVRRVATTLLSASSLAVSTAQMMAFGSEPSVWERQVSDGVSANLLDALSRITGSDEHSGDVQIRMDWTWMAPAELTPVVVVPQGLAPILAAGADYLREPREEHSIRLTGRVTRLHREEALGPGDITVRGLIENWDASSRSMRINLDETTYRRAISAHDAGTTVQVSALVRRTPHGLQVVQVEDFHVPVV